MTFFTISTRRRVGLYRCLPFREILTTKQSSRVKSQYFVTSTHSRPRKNFPASHPTPITNYVHFNMSIIVEDNKRLKTELIGEGVVGCDNADFRQEYRRIDKILCSLLIRNCSGSDTLSDAELQQLGIEVGSLDLQTGAASSAAHHFFPNYEIPRIQESSIPTGKLIADGKWLREWLTSLTETFSGFGDPVRVHTSHLFPTTLRNSMDSYLRAFDKDFSEEFFDG